MKSLCKTLEACGESGMQELKLNGKNEMWVIKFEKVEKPRLHNRESHNREFPPVVPSAPVDEWDTLPKRQKKNRLDTELDDIAKERTEYLYRKYYEYCD